MAAVRANADVTSEKPAPPERNPGSTYERIRRYVVVSFRDGRFDGIDRDTPLVSSGIVDSAGVLQLVEWLEKSFAIAIPDEAVGIENFESLGALTRLVASCSDAAAD